MEDGRRSEQGQLAWRFGLSCDQYRIVMGYAATSRQGTHRRGMVVFVNEIVYVLSPYHHR